MRKWFRLKHAPDIQASGDDNGGLNEAVESKHAEQPVESSVAGSAVMSATSFSSAGLEREVWDCIAEFKRTSTDAQIDTKEDFVKHMHTALTKVETKLLQQLLCSTPVEEYIQGCLDHSATKHIVSPSRLQAAHRSLSEVLKCCCREDVLIQLMQVNGKFSDVTEFLTRAWAGDAQLFFNQEICKDREEARVLTVNKAIACHLCANVAEASMRALRAAFDGQVLAALPRVSEEGRIMVEPPKDGSSQFTKHDSPNDATRAEHAQSKTHATSSFVRNGNTMKGSKAKWQPCGNELQKAERIDEEEEWDKFCAMSERKNERNGLDE